MLKRLAWLAFVLGTVSAAAQEKSPPQVGIAAFGVSDQLGVFRREAEEGAKALARFLKTERPPVIRVNRPGRPDAVPAQLPAALAEAAKPLDRERDILIVFATAHGTRAGLEVRAGKRSETLSPADLRAMLDATGIRHRIVIISACYSGVFAEALANDTTLVLTAADPWHPSFGCRPGVRWTFYGEALFEKALPQASSFPEAYRLASQEVLKRETARKLKPSNPRSPEAAPFLPDWKGNRFHRPLPFRHRRCDATFASSPPARTRNALFSMAIAAASWWEPSAWGSPRGPRFVAAGGSCGDTMPPGSLLAQDRLKVEGQVYTLFPDCRGAAKTTD